MTSGESQVTAKSNNIQNLLCRHNSFLELIQVPSNMVYQQLNIFLIVLLLNLQQIQNQQFSLHLQYQPTQQHNHHHHHQQQKQQQAEKRTHQNIVTFNITMKTML